MGWARRTLGEVCDEVQGIIRTGPFGSQLHQSDYKDEGLPVVMPKDIVDGKVSTLEIARIGDQDVNRLSQHQLKKGDIVYGRRGDIGRRALITDRENGWLCGTGCLRISLGNSVINPLFLYYYLGQSDVIAYIYNQAIGATLPNLNTTIIRNIPVVYPQLSTQRKIASILSAYDDLIVNNTRRIKILEEMAQSLYHEWFVKFRFPGHEQVKMVESALGLIPEGWKVKNLDNIVSEIIDYRGKTPKKLGGDWVVSGIKALSALNIKNGKLINLEKCKFLSEELYKKWMKSELMQGDILMTSEAPLGELYYLTKKNKFCLSQRLYSIRANPESIKPVILYLALSSPLIQGELTSRQSGTTVLGIRQSELRKVPFIIPPINLQPYAAQILETFLQTVSILEEKNKNLRQTRDLLLPKLISGKIDVEPIDIDTPENAA